jgi:hypothetical protein
VRTRSSRVSYRISKRRKTTWRRHTKIARKASSKCWEDAAAERTKALPGRVQGRAEEVGRRCVCGIDDNTLYFCLMLERARCNEQEDIAQCGSRFLHLARCHLHDLTSIQEKNCVAQDRCHPAETPLSSILALHVLRRNKPAIL